MVTVSRTLLGTVLTVFVTSLVAYGLSHKLLVGRKLYMALFIFAMYFSGGVIPYYMVLRTLGLVNRFLVYIIPGALNMFLCWSPFPSSRRSRRRWRNRPGWTEPAN